MTQECFNNLGWPGVAIITKAIWIISHDEARTCLIPLYQAGINVVMHAAGNAINGHLAHCTLIKLCVKVGQTEGM